MGTFIVQFTLRNLAQPERSVVLSGLVDTGAAFPFVPDSTLRALGIEPEDERTFVLADGSQKSFSVGRAEFAFDGVRAPCLVVFGPEGSEALLGALALESLGLEVDPVNRRLKPATLYLAAGSGQLTR